LRGYGQELGAPRGHVHGPRTEQHFRDPRGKAASRCIDRAMMPVGQSSMLSGTDDIPVCANAASAITIQQPSNRAAPALRADA